MNRLNILLPQHPHLNNTHNLHSMVNMKWYVIFVTVSSNYLISLRKYPKVISSTKTSVGAQIDNCIDVRGKHSPMT